MAQLPKPVGLQKIFFGPPGCGKSFHIRKVAIGDLGISENLESLKKSPNMIETAFHPEYGYGDFVAKLLPQTENGQIKYSIHAGPLIKALARAYANPDQNVLLTIDEINRGNCAQIFGDIFQLLDRDAEGWSEYGVDPSDLIKAALEQELFDEHKKTLMDLPIKLNNDAGEFCKLRLPPKLSLIGTMNTSDESVYYMDTAFKRRWDFEYMPWHGANGKNDAPELKSQKDAKIENTDHTWDRFLGNLNEFVAEKFKERNVDDKQVGIWFLKSPNLAEMVRYVTELAMFRKNLEKLSANSCNEKGKAAWRACFPNTGDNTGTELAKSIQAANHEPIKEHLKSTYKIELPDNYFDKIGSSQLAANLITHIEVINVSAVITHAAIQNKLMFFLWDNVFSRDRKPLHDLLMKGNKDAKEPRTFGEFSKNVDDFIKGVMEWNKPAVVEQQD